MSEIKTEEDEKPPLPEEENESDILNKIEKESSNYKGINILNNEQNKLNNQSHDSGIIEVFKDNLNIEMKNLISLINEYNYIGMDTEFPGIVYSISSVEEDFYYKSLKLNTESLKLIQLGITLSNSKGESPKPYHTWQFNFEFDYLKDKYSEPSLKLLISSGINFNKLKANGINHTKFFQIFKNSGLVLNPKIYWVSFHGNYDFAYLLKNLLGNSLPKNEEDFSELLRAFFPNYYDIKILVKEKFNMQGSLNKLAQNLNIIRKGKLHQAGSDSLVTIKVFWKLLKSGYISREELIENKNIIYGILQGKDKEKNFNYPNINFIINNSINNNINNSAKIYNENNYIWLQYPYNMNMNYYYPQFNMNGINYIRMINNKNNLLQYC